MQSTTIEPFEKLNLMPKIPLNPPFSKGEALMLLPFRRGTPSCFSLFKEGIHLAPPFCKGRVGGIFQALSVLIIL